MLGFFKMKILLLGAVVASPAVITWVWRGGEPSAVVGVHPVAHVTTTVLAEPTVKVPVEVVSKGSAPQWVYVEVGGADSVPEPGVMPLVVLPALALVLRRRREK